MALFEFADIVQGSDEWYAQRRGMVTASEIGKLITPSTVKVASNIEVRELTARLVAERITGYTEPTYVGDDMLRGIADEPVALEVYAKRYSRPVRTTGFMVRDDWGYKIGCSPDGLVGLDGMVEVKSRMQKHHLRTILDGEVPKEFMAQVQCGLLVTGTDWCDFISYCGGMPLFVRRVEPDPVWFTAVTDAVAVFEMNAADMVRAYKKATKGLAATERVVEMEMAL